jgi:hypothetical protein
VRKTCADRPTLWINVHDTSDLTTPQPTIQSAPNKHQHADLDTLHRMSEGCFDPGLVRNRPSTLSPPQRPCAPRTHTPPLRTRSSHHAQRVPRGRKPLSVRNHPILRSRTPRKGRRGMFGLLSAMTSSGQNFRPPYLRTQVSNPILSNTTMLSSTRRIR